MNIISIENQYKSLLYCFCEKTSTITKGADKNESKTKIKNGNKFFFAKIGPENKSTIEVEVSEEPLRDARSKPIELSNNFRGSNIF